MKVTIIGLGEIGENILKKMTRIIDCYGVDINDKVLENLSKEGYKVGKEILISDVYIISVYTTKQVMDVIQKLDYSLDPLVIIESTILPRFHKQILKWATSKEIQMNLVVFPHRFNPNDKDHHVFNLDRVIGCIDKETEKRALDFYTKFMDRKLIHIYPLEIAELVKPLENAYRFIEITIAEEIKILCDRYMINFEKLRNAMNTKWNIDLKDARNGAEGKCLPKDTNLINKFFSENIIFNVAINLNEAYKKYIKNKRK